MPMLTSNRGGARRLLTGNASLVRAGLRRADARAGARLAGDRPRWAHADPGADRLGQDARGLPLRDRPAQPRSPARACALLYVSPLKALNYDIERNLRGPLAGLGSKLRVGVRTGDTPQKRARRDAAQPPDILITTPESLFLLLTSQARETLRGDRDRDRGRGARRRGHEARRASRADASSGLDRLAEQADPADRAFGDAAPARGDRPLRRRRRVRSSSSTPARAKELDLKVVVPLDDMRETGGAAVDLAVDLPGDPRARPRAPLDDRVRQQPPSGRAARAPARTSSPRKRSRAPTTARWRASSASRSRSC